MYLTYLYLSTVKLKFLWTVHSEFYFDFPMLHLYFPCYSLYEAPFRKGPSHSAKQRQGQRQLRALVVYRVMCPNFGHPAPTSSLTKYKFSLMKKKGFAIVNGLSVLK